jgi:hypothetical protein
VSHGFELEPARAAAVPDNPAIAAAMALLASINRGLMRLSMIALVLTAVILTYSVVSRYFFQAPTDWQDEASVFMLVGVTFFCTAYVQSQRGHIGIEAIAGLLPPASMRCACCWWTWCRHCSAPSSPGSRGRCSMKPGSMARPPPPPSRRRCGSPTA